MELKALRCPACDGTIEMDLTGRTTVFCPWCGIQIAVNGDEKVHTYNINKNVNIHKRYTNDAAVEKQKRKAQEEKMNNYVLIGYFVFAFLFLLLMIIWYMATESADRRETQEKINRGMIQVGQSSNDMVGKDVNLVKEQLESAGFANITLIEVKDKSWFHKNKGNVESITIGGDASFYSSDYFYPDVKIVISYYK